MSTDRATGIDSTDPTNDESPDLIAQLLRRVEALEAENEQLRAELDDVRDRHREDCHALARKNHDLRQSQHQLRGRVAKAEEKDDFLLDDIIDLEDQLADLENGATSSENESESTETTTQAVELTPIERVSKLDAEDTAIDVTPSIERAVTIFEHWEEWSEKTPKGRVLKDGLKTLLRTATGAKLAWRQVYRAAEALEKLSKRKIQFVDHNRHGKMLIEPYPVKNHDCHAASAAKS